MNSIFNKPNIRIIGGVNLRVYKLGFAQFDDALFLANQLTSMNWKDPAKLPQALASFKAGTPERTVLCQLIAGSLALADGCNDRLPVADVEAMPVITLVEAITVLLEINADFFIQTLPSLLGAVQRIKLIGSALPSSWLAQGTAPAN